MSSAMLTCARFLSCLVTHVSPCRPAECGPEEAGGEPGALPAPALLHGRLRTPDGARQPELPHAERAGADAADLGCEEHDVRGRPAARPLPHGLRPLPRQNVHQGGKSHAHDLSSCPILLSEAPKLLLPASQCCNMRVLQSPHPPCVQHVLGVPKIRGCVAGRRWTSRC